MCIRDSNSPARYFFEDFPGQWDETQLLAGEPGEYVNTARRSGENWYLGLICNEQRTAEFQLDFLGEGDYYAFIYEDGETVDDITARIEKVDKDTVLTIPMAEHGGAMIKILRNQPSQAESITLSASELTLEQNDSTVLTATLTPEDVEYDTVTSVSYTHLDVYKRQAVHHVKVLLCQSASKPCIGITATTHQTAYRVILRRTHPLRQDRQSLGQFFGILTENGLSIEQHISL